jgi:ornithine decarboxylase
MAGPFMLPADVQAGDYVEIGMLGAYGCAMRTGFNGFGSDAKVIVEDEPMATLYGDGVREVARNNVVKL